MPGCVYPEKLAVWKPPFENTEAMQRDARLWLRVYLSRQNFDGERAFAWLMRVGMLTNRSAQLSDEAMAARCYAYLESMTEFPAALFCARSAAAAAKCDSGFFPSWEKLSGFLEQHREYLTRRAQRLMQIADGKTSPRPKPIPKPGEEDRIPATDEQKAFVAAEVARAVAALTGKTKEPGQQPLTVRGLVANANAFRDHRARQDAEYAADLERSRRLALAVDAGGANHGKFIVPMTDPLHGDLRAFYGHACPGYDPPAPPTAAEQHEAQEAAE